MFLQSMISTVKIESTIKKDCTGSWYVSTTRTYGSLCPFSAIAFSISHASCKRDVWLYVVQKLFLLTYRNCVDNVFMVWFSSCLWCIYTRYINDVIIEESGISFISKWNTHDSCSYILLSSVGISSIIQERLGFSTDLGNKTRGDRVFIQLLLKDDWNCSMCTIRCISPKI